MKYSVIAACIVGGTLLSGCATQGKSSSSLAQRTPAIISNELVVSQPYSQVWDKLVRELSKSYYVINNIDKESRIINVSFNSSSPQEYVDCGSTSRTFTKGDKTETFNYDVAASSSYKMATPRQPSPAFSYFAIVKRTTNLEGRSNIYLAPDDGDKAKTRVAVNTRYLLSINVRGDVFQESLSGQIVSSAQVPSEQPISIAFNTNKPVQHDFGQGEITTCFGKGKLEREVLGLIQN